MDVHPPIDIDGRDLRAGDWVLVVSVPLSIRFMPDESKDAFSRAVGHTFKVQEFEDDGCLHLDLYPKVVFPSGEEGGTRHDMIYLEPFCARRYRRYKQPFPILPAIYELKYKVKLKQDADFDKFSNLLCGRRKRGVGWGYSPDWGHNQYRGNYTVEQWRPDAMDIIEEFRQSLLTRQDTIELSFEEVTSFPATDGSTRDRPDQTLF